MEKMEKKVEWEQKISKITSVIHESYPELVTFMAEMPVEHVKNEEVTVKKLEEYFHSLEELVEKYTKSPQS